MEFTPNYNLKKPAAEDFYNVNDYNENADIIDAELSNKVNKSEYTANDVLDKLKTVDGSGSGLDADTVDGKHASDFATAAQGTKADNALPKTGGTMTGILTAQSNTSYTVRQVRNIILSAADADVGAMQNGDIWIKYK